jgi:rare lipoprotein A
MLQSGEASWYSATFQGRLTANGERYDGGALTAAHRTLPLGSYVRVRSLG